MNGEWLRNGDEARESTFNIVQAHPVLIVTIGTTTVELSPIIKAQIEGMGDIVPWRCICVDSMPYEDVVTRLTQNGWARKQIVEVIPRSHYFELTSPFTDAFDFDNPLNKSWQFTVFDPVLRRLAKRPEGPGCAGTPALGRARVEGNEQELARFFRDHLDELCQLRTETLALKNGVMAFVITTYRGGTGTGATMPAAAILRQAMDAGFIHLHAIMPDAYKADQRAYANAFAAALENQGCHQYEHGVPLKSGQMLKAPLDSAAYIFGRNGSVALHSKDLLMQVSGPPREDAILTSEKGVQGFL